MRISAFIKGVGKGSPDPLLFCCLHYSTCREDAEFKVHRRSQETVTRYQVCLHFDLVSHLTMGALSWHRETPLLSCQACGEGHSRCAWKNGETQEQQGKRNNPQAIQDFQDRNLSPPDTATKGPLVSESTQPLSSEGVVSLERCKP